MAKISVEQKLHEIEWQPGWEGLRLKEVLKSALPDLSTRALVLIVNNGLVQQLGTVLEDLDAVPDAAALTVDLRHGVKGQRAPKNPRLLDQMKVVYDDECIVVVSKAAGVVVQPIPEEKPRAGQKPLIELLKHYWRSQNQKQVNPILVSRLDKDTSGLMVLAKSVPAGRNLQRQAASHMMERHYRAVVEGTVNEEKGTWRSMIGEGEGGIRQNLGRIPDDLEQIKQFPGQKSITHWKVLERLSSYTLLELRLETGRTHQIRIHCAEAGFPVVGDRVYRRLARMRHGRRFEGKVQYPRMMLHSVKLKFQHPEKSSRWLTFRDDLPHDIIKFMQEHGA